MKIKDVISKRPDEIYSANKKSYTWTTETWTDKSTRRTRHDFLEYVLGDKEDIVSYYEAKSPDDKIVISKVSNISIDSLDEKVYEITPETGKKARDFIIKKNELQKELDELVWED